jgi:hypothetical protein
VGKYTFKGGKVLAKSDPFAPIRREAKKATEAGVIIFVSIVTSPLTQKRR